MQFECSGQIRIDVLNATLCDIRLVEVGSPEASPHEGCRAAAKEAYVELGATEVAPFNTGFVEKLAPSKIAVRERAARKIYSIKFGIVKYEVGEIHAV
jgi:hypothetical protein